MKNQIYFFSFTRLAALFALLFLQLSCVKGPDLFKQVNGGEAYSVVTNEVADGVYEGLFNPAVSANQIFSVAGGAANGSSASFPPGALNIPTRITLEEGASLVSGISASELVGGAELSAAGPVLAMDANPAANASQPLTLRIPFRSASLSLGPSDGFLAIFFKVRDEETGEYRLGVIPTAGIKINDTFAEFKTKRFGSFQAIWVATPVTVAKEVKSETPIVSKRQENSLPPVAWTISAVLGSQEEIGVRVSAKGLSELRDCQVFAYKDHGGSPLLEYGPPPSGIDSEKARDLASLQAGQTIFPHFSYRNTSASPISVSLVVECQEKNGRMSRSEFTESVLLPVFSSAQGNNAPLLAPMTPITGSENTPIASIDPQDSRTGNDTDIDGDVLSYTCRYSTVSSSGPFDSSCSSLGMAETSGVWNWTPSFSQSGIYYVQIVADDGRGGINSLVFNVSIANLNRAPILDHINNFSGFVGNTVPFVDAGVLGNDFDADGDALTYSCVIAQSVASYSAGDPCSDLGASFNMNTGYLSSWVPTAADIYQLRIDANDGQAGADSRTFIIMVTQPFELTAPPSGDSIPSRIFGKTGSTTSYNITFKCEPGKTIRLEGDLNSSPYDYPCAGPTGSITLHYDNFGGSPKVTTGFGRKNFTIGEWGGSSYVASESFYLLYVPGDITSYEAIATADELSNALHSNDILLQNKLYYLTDNIPSVGNWVPAKASIDPGCSNGFKAVFFGNNFTISDLEISNMFSDNQGLFCKLNGATITDLTLTNVSISESGLQEQIGALAGAVTGAAMINNCHVSGAVVAASSLYVGGMFGKISSGSGRIWNSSADVSVTAQTYVGGLLGWAGNSGTGDLARVVYKSFSRGNVYSGNGAEIGGLMGSLYGGTVERSWSSGDVTASSSDKVGGLIGYGGGSPGGTILDSYAEGDVSGDTFVGGLIGKIDALDLGITRSYASGDVDVATNYGGGFIGKSTLTGPSKISYSFSSGSITGAGFGGFAGYFDGLVSATNVYWNNSSLFCDQINNAKCSVPSEGIDDWSPFQGLTPSNSMVNSWDLTNIWQGMDGNFPTLRDVP